MGIIQKFINWSHDRETKKAKKGGWTPKNLYEMEEAYGKYMEEAWNKIESLDKSGIKVPVQGSGYYDFPPYKGVVIYVNESCPKSILNQFKQEIENDHVTVEVRGTTYLS